VAKSQACKNRRIGARFEGDVRKALRNNGYFIYTKASSCPGIDIFALRDNQAV
jgi:Holliday junction resolvase